MGKRRYDQVARAENAELTRRRILDAVGQRLREAPNEQVSLDRVARIADVSRTTIYADFGSRAGLFDAFVRDLWERTGFGQLVSAVGADDPHDHLREAIGAASRMKARDIEVYRVLHAMDRIDPASAGDAVRSMEEDRRGGITHLVDRLAGAGLLRADVAPEWAVDVLWMLTSFDALDHLVTGRGLALDDAIERLVTTAERALCTAKSASPTKEHTSA